MSAHHSWLTFTIEGPLLPHTLDADPGPWQRSLSAQHARWYDGVAPPAVAAVFVLQWLLQLPAHVAAHAAASGTGRATGLERLTFSLGPGLVPDVVRLVGIEPGRAPVARRLATAEADYREVAEPLSQQFPAPVRLGRHVRSALVEDMWAAARREAEASVGLIGLGPTHRASCCLIYALPGCSECAGCPRLRVLPTGR